MYNIIGVQNKGMEIHALMHGQLQIHDLKGRCGVSDLAKLFTVNK